MQRSEAAGAAASSSGSRRPRAPAGQAAEAAGPWRATLAILVVLAASPATAATAQRGALDYQSQPDAATGGRPVSIAWRFQAAGPVRNAVELHEGVVYVSSADGYVHALDADTGLPRWARHLGVAPGAPVADGELLVVVDRHNRVHALARDSGETRWTRETGPDLELRWGREGWDYLLPAPAIHEGRIYAGSGDGGLYVLEAADGRVVWTYRTDGRIRATPAVRDGVVYVGSGDGYFHAVDAASGDRRWRFRTEGVALDGADFGFDRTQVTGAASVTDEAVYFGSRDARLYALERESGNELWRVEEPSAWVIATPAVTPDTVYSARSSSANLRAVARDSGEERWLKTLDAPVFASPVIVGDRLYAATGNGTVYAFDRASGREAWTVQVDGGVWGTPVAHAGRLYLAGDGGTVYALTDHAPKPRRLAVFWDEELLKWSSQASDPKRARALASELVARGYQALNRAALESFLAATREAPRSVVVFAMDGLPLPDVDADSELAAYLEEGGTAVWLGRPPGILVRAREPGRFRRLAPENPAALVGVPFDAWNGDHYPSAPTAAGRRRGLPGIFTASPSAGAGAEIEVLARDELGRPVAWVRDYGGRPGSGFVYLGRLWMNAQACTIASVASYGLGSGGFAPGAPACDSPE